MKSVSCGAITLGVVALDQITKHMVRTSFGPFETVPLLPFLRLVHVRNEGAAFGMFQGLGNQAFIAISIAAILFVFILLAKSREDRLGLSLILGGAIGNLLDRIAFGRVTDFIDVFAGNFHWPAFNVADSALTIGLVLLLAAAFIQRKRGAA